MAPWRGGDGGQLGLDGVAAITWEEREREGWWWPRLDGGWVAATQGGGKNRSGRLGLRKRNRGSPLPD
jgi:hypothetical protein